MTWYIVNDQNLWLLINGKHLSETVFVPSCLVFCFEWASFNCTLLKALTAKTFYQMCVGAPWPSRNYTDIAVRNYEWKICFLTDMSVPTVNKNVNRKTPWKKYRDLDSEIEKNVALKTTIVPAIVWAQCMIKKGKMITLTRFLAVPANMKSTRSQYLDMLLSV